MYMNKGILFLLVFIVISSVGCGIYSQHSTAANEKRAGEAYRQTAEARSPSFEPSNDITPDVITFENCPSSNPWGDVVFYGQSPPSLQNELTHTREIVAAMKSMSPIIKIGIVCRQSTKAFEVTETMFFFISALVDNPTKFNLNNYDNVIFSIQAGSGIKLPLSDDLNQLILLNRLLVVGGAGNNPDDAFPLYPTRIDGIICVSGSSPEPSLTLADKPLIHKYSTSCRDQSLSIVANIHSPISDSSQGGTSLSTAKAAAWMATNQDLSKKGLFEIGSLYGCQKHGYQYIENYGCVIPDLQ